MIDLLLGNLCSLLATVTDSLSSTRKRTRDVLLLQALSQLIYLFGSIILKGYSAAVQNAVSIVRNLAATRKTLPKWTEWILVALGVILGLWFNNRGVFGWLPVIANLEYSLAVFRLKNNERALKLAFCLSALLYCIFNAVVLNFVGIACNVVVLVVTLTYLVKNFKAKA